MEDTVFLKKAKIKQKVSKAILSMIVGESKASEVLRRLKEATISTGQGGQKAGALEIAKTTVDKALDFINKKDFDLSQIPDFEKNFKMAKQAAAIGWTKRKDMPVIDTEDVRKLQQRLKNGNLDIFKPFADDTNPKNPFPKGLSGFEAVKFMDRGLRDGQIKDDQVDVRITKKSVKKLKPIQKQIYFDKAMGSTIKFGLDASMDFIKNKSFFVISKDNYIIDGHHRYLSAMLIDSDTQVNCLEIDLPLNKLLPLSLSYSDALGKERNV